MVNRILDGIIGVGAIGSTNYRFERKEKVPVNLVYGLQQEGCTDDFAKVFVAHVVVIDYYSFFGIAIADVYGF
jgi:hypothetical protein